MTSGRGGSSWPPAQQGQAVLREILVGMVIVEVPAGDGKDPEGFAGQLVVDVGHLAPVILGKRTSVPAQETVSHGRPAPVASL